MDALVKVALERVIETVTNIPEPKNTYKTEKISIRVDRTEEIKKAIRAVDALKSALKTLDSTRPSSTVSELLKDPEQRAEYLRITNPQKK